jgi:hypothetical protein
MSASPPQGVAQGWQNDAPLEFVRLSRLSCVVLIPKGFRRIAQG